MANVLLVMDYPGRRGLTQSLIRHGHTAYGACSLSAVRRHLKAHLIDVIVAKCELDDDNTGQGLVHLGYPVIIADAVTEVEAERLRSAGVCEVAVEPYDAHLISDLIALAIRKGRKPKIAPPINEAFGKNP